FLQRPVELLARGPDERPPLLVLLVAGLLADEHDRGVIRPLAEDGLRADPPEVAAMAARRGLAQRRERPPRGEKVGGGAGLLGHGATLCRADGPKTPGRVRAAATWPSG